MHKIHTIKKKHEFLQIKNQGKTFFSKYFLLQYLPNFDEKNIQIGLIVTKKLGNAVMRNKIKRRLRAMIRNIIDAHPYIVSGKYVFIGNKNSLEGLFLDMSKSFEKIYKKIYIDYFLTRSV